MDGDGSFKGWLLGKFKIKVKYYVVVKGEIVGKLSIREFRYKVFCYDEML